MRPVTVTAVSCSQKGVFRLLAEAHETSLAVDRSNLTRHFQGFLVAGVAASLFRTGHRCDHPAPRQLAIDGWPLRLLQEIDA